MLNVRFRPITLWPHDSTPPDRRRSSYTFKAPGRTRWTCWTASYVTWAPRTSSSAAGCASRTYATTAGRARARACPEHPGVEISFDGVPLNGPMGRLVYATDVCRCWEHNVRAIGLGLEALRAVDRHGITRRGEQYAGFKALPVSADAPSYDRGRALVDEHGSVTAAMRATHPDTGGSRIDFESVLLYREAA